MSRPNIYCAASTGVWISVICMFTWRLSRVDGAHAGPQLLLWLSFRAAIVRRVHLNLAYYWFYRTSPKTRALIT